MRIRLLLAAPIGAATVAAVFALTTGVEGANLIVNGGFEDAEGGVPTAWQTVGAGIVTDDLEPDGDNEGVLVLTSPAGLLYQQVALEPGKSYHLSGEYVALVGAVTSAELRVTYADADSTPLEPERADPLYGPGTWTIDAFKVPCEAAAARVEVLATGSPSGIIYLDDLHLSEIPAFLTVRRPRPLHRQRLCQPTRRARLRLSFPLRRRHGR